MKAFFVSHNSAGAKKHQSKRLAFKVAKKTNGFVTCHNKKNGVNVNWPNLECAK